MTTSPPSDKPSELSTWGNVDHFAFGNVANLPVPEQLSHIEVSKDGRPCPEAYARPSVYRTKPE